MSHEQPPSPVTADLFTLSEDQFNEISQQLKQRNLDEVQAGQTLNDILSQSSDDSLQQLSVEIGPAQKVTTPDGRTGYLSNGIYSDAHDKLLFDFTTVDRGKAESAMIEVEKPLATEAGDVVDVESAPAAPHIRRGQRGEAKSPASKGYDHKKAVDYHQRKQQRREGGQPDLLDTEAIFQTNKHQEWAAAELRKLDMFSISSELTRARAKLVEARVKARHGGLLSNQSRRSDKLERAAERYYDQRSTLQQQLLDSYLTQDEYDEIKTAAQQRYGGDNDIDVEHKIRKELGELGQITFVSLAQKRALVAQLSAREDGALMGEEANYYLTKEDSWSARMMDRYRSAGKWKRRMINVGGVAVVGAGAGFIGGMAAAGAVIGARVGRGYVSREARRDGGIVGGNREERMKARQMDATLDQSNQQDYIDMYHVVRDHVSFDEQRNFAKITTGDLRQTVAEQRQQTVATVRERYKQALSEAQVETKAKRKSARAALGGAAVGATAGALIDALHDAGTFDTLEGRVDWLKEKLPFTDSGTVDIVETNPDSDSIAEAQQQLDAAEQRAEDAQDRLDAAESRSRQLDRQEAANQSPDDAPAGSDDEVGETTDTDETATEADDAEAESTTPSATAEAAFGELAGERVSVTISEGSTLRNALLEYVGRQDLSLNSEQESELVSNIVRKLRDDVYPRDLDLVYTGETFTAVLN